MIIASTTISNIYYFPLAPLAMILAFKCPNNLLTRPHIQAIQLTLQH